MSPSATNSHQPQETVSPTEEMIRASWRRLLQFREPTFYELLALAATSRNVKWAVKLGIAVYATPCVAADARRL